MTAFFLQYLKHQKRRSPHTVIAYATDLDQFAQFLQLTTRIHIWEAKKKDIRSWIIALSEDGISPTSINRKLSTLRSFFEFLLAEDKVVQNPLQTIASLKKPKRLPVYVRENEMKILFENLENSSDFSGLRDELVFNLLYGTGIRLSELLSLTWGSVDVQTGQIRVMGKRSKERIIPMPQKLIHLLIKYRNFIETQLPDLSNQKLILTNSGKPAYPVLVERIVKKHLRMVTTENKKSPHVIRHTYATHLLSAGAEINSIKELLGHSSLAATQVYTHNTVTKLKEAYANAHPRAKRALD